MAGRMTTVLLFLLTIAYAVATKELNLGTNSGQKSNKVLIKYEGTLEEVKAYGSSLDLEFQRWIFKDWYVFTISRTDPADPLGIRDVPDLHLDLRREQKRDKKVKFIEQERYVKRVLKSLGINDEYWPKQWHLQPKHVPNMNVHKAWEKGFTGKGVTVSLIDDGLDVNHTDFAENYNASLSYDYIADVPDPSHKHPDDGHGTSCAGLFAAANNTNCVIGISHEVNFGAVRVIDSSGEANITSSDEALALTHAFQYIDICSNSWGPYDDGVSLGFLDDVLQEALELTIKEGRNGKGIIHTWASGNGGPADTCNADLYSSNMYTISIASTDETGKPTFYSEPCTSVLAATFGGTFDVNLTTTGVNDTCRDGFLGTSAATPMATGIIAMTLQANRNLTWRDVQHMIVEYSNFSALTHSSDTHGEHEFYKNGVGKDVSIWSGFGMMDAEAMVDNAPNWSTVPPRLSCTSSDLYLDRTSNESIEVFYTLSDCFIKHLEHVEVSVLYNSSYRGSVEFRLLSPMLTESKILPARPYDNYTWATVFKYMSVHTWGEDPNGEWKLTLFPKYNETDMHLYEWRLEVFGTATPPLDGIPPEGTFGSPCTNSSSCSALADGGCLQDRNDMCDKICVSCNNGYRLDGDFCVQDCPALFAPDGGYVEVTNDTGVLVATYTCYYEFGYEYTEGNVTRTCGSDGKWSGVEPICDLVDCGPLENPANGNVSFENTTYGSVAMYLCAEGYAISAGDMYRFCYEDKEWSGTEPTCSPDCGIPEHPQNGTVFYMYTFEGSVAMYTCIEGYTISEGDVNRTCGSDGMWASVDPVCSIDCGSLEHPVDGMVSYTGTFEGSEAVYTCNEGYILTGGDATRTCGETGTWSSMPPLCLIDCGQLEKPEYGDVTFMETFQGSEAMYTCIDGYVVSNGDAKRTCEADGQWTSVQPECLIDCGPLNAPANGLVSVSTTTEGSNALYVCSSGYAVSSGHTLRICRSDGMWTGTEPLCDIDCGRLENPQNGLVSWKMTTKGSEATYICLNGYTIDTGNSRRTCGDSGNWDGTEPTCMPSEAVEKAEDTDTIAIVIVVASVAGGIIILAIVVICILMYYKNHKSSEYLYR